MVQADVADDHLSQIVVPGEGDSDRVLGVEAGALADVGVFGVDRGGVPIGELPLCHPRPGRGCRTIRGMDMHSGEREMLREIIGEGEHILALVGGPTAPSKTRAA